LKLWINGELVDEGEARVSPFDHGLLVGDGVFETLRVYNGVPFAWRRHCERLAHSASALGLTVPDGVTLRDAADTVLRANGLRDGRLRVTITGGPAPLGSERGEAPPTVLVAVGDARSWPPTERVVMVPWTRNEHGATAGLKTISYAENVRALAFAHERGVNEALFCNTRGELCEATGSNVFVVTEGSVRTPAADSGCLLGVTRALTLELCIEHGVRCEEGAVTPDELRHADEAFLTSTTREIQPIGQVDDVVLSSAPGPVTTRLAEAFRSLVARDLDP
jgi:branched-chain amino acid aminotransferase